MYNILISGYYVCFFNFFKFEFFAIQRKFDIFPIIGKLSNLQC